MKTNIPIYRAKKIDSEEYVKGYLVRADDYRTDVDEDQIIYFIMDKMENYRTTEVWDFVQNSRIDPTTLAIHFSNMIDIKGDKIFASLQEDGKGGDILFDMEYEFTLIFDGLNFRLEGSHYTTEISGYDKFTDFDSIGIQQRVIKCLKRESINY